MEGIAVRRLRNAGAAPSRTDFEDFFSCLYPSLQESAWFLENAMIAPPAEWEERSDSVLDRPRGPEWDEFFGFIVAVADPEGASSLRLMSAGFVPRYGRYLVDDWCELAALPSALATPATLAAAAGRAPGTLWQLPFIEASFHNVDAAFWEFRAHDASLVLAVQHHLAGRRDVRIDPLPVGA